MYSLLKKLFSTTPESKEPRLLDSIDDIVRTPGKACSITLMNLALNSSEDDFVQIVHCPSLVGSAIRDGDVLSEPLYGSDLLSAKTSRFKSSEVALFVKGSQLEHSIFILRREDSSAHKSRYLSFDIGRAKDNDIRIFDVAISRYHARITISNQGASIIDLRSQNGTKVNGLPISDLPHTLQDGDIISLGRYEFSFLLPSTLYQKLRARKSS